jgi:DNA-binding NarL/FixJ family response regulator
VSAGGPGVGEADAVAESRIRVLLVDDQALFRAGVRMLVGSQPDLELAGEAANGAEGVELARSLRPDVVLMDIRMPVMDGIAATTAIVADAEREGRTPPRIVVLTTFDLDEAAARAIRGGASGFVLKDAEPEFLLAAIRTVHAGSAVIAAGATRELFQYFSDNTPAKPEPAEFATLTSREREIFVLAARGLSNSEIAGTEYLSEATVKTHISRILAKLGLRDRVQMVEHGLTGATD